MRKGQNPAKFVKEVAKPHRITAAVLNYIPFLSGYYVESLNVLKVCLRSLREGADLPFDLLVFDNGSCQEVREFLIQERFEGRIQYLILSEWNLGKGGAWNIIFGGAPGEIIAYADSDVLFYKGWLSRSIEILETYLNVGMVTARPFRSKPDFFTRTVEWAKQAPGVTLEEGQFLSWEVYRDFNLSLGHTEEEIRKKYQATRDIRVLYKGVIAHVGASHWQFVAWKSVLQQFLPFDMEKPMGQVRRLDERMNAAGYLRLMVSDPLAMNMSNTPIHPQSAAKPVALAKRSLWRKMLNFPLVKKSLLVVYDSIFRWYYAN